MYSSVRYRAKESVIISKSQESTYLTQLEVTRKIREMHRFLFERAAVLIILILLSASCVHMRDFSSNPKGYKNNIETRSAHETAIIEYKNGAKQKAQSISLIGDSLKYTDPGNYTHRVASISDIRSIQFKNRIAGAFEGMGIGFLIGAGIGAIAGFGSGDDSSSGWFSLTAGEKAAIGGASFGIIGSLIGFPSGYAAGDKRVYNFQADSTNSTKPIVLKNRE